MGSTTNAILPIIPPSPSSNASNMHRYAPVVLMASFMALIPLLFMYLGGGGEGEQSFWQIPHPEQDNDKVLSLDDPSSFLSSQFLSSWEMQQQQQKRGSESPQQQRRRQTADVKTIGGPQTQKNHQRQRQPVVTPYQYWNSESIYETLQEWKRRYPDLVQVTSAQQAYGLKQKHSNNNSNNNNNFNVDCPFESSSLGGGCQNWILTIADQLQTETLPFMPQVFLSGALHGDERVGPTVVMEVAQLLLEAAHCESLPQGHHHINRRRHRPVHHNNDGLKSNSTNKDNNSSSYTLSKQELRQEIIQAKQCRQDLTNRGIYPIYRKWLARLVTTRKIIILPAANAVGFYRGIRGEPSSSSSLQQQKEGLSSRTEPKPTLLDPNRDFPYDVAPPPAQDNTKKGECFLQTMAAKTIAHVFMNHMIQMSVTFHGGMEAIAYEWGAPAHDHQMAPDVISQRAIATVYQRYAGPILTSSAQQQQQQQYLRQSPQSKTQGERNDYHYYPIGTMNELVYPVHGGMEDWSYAGSWDRGFVPQAFPSNTSMCFDNEIPLSLLPLSNGYSLRTFTTLVEISNDKTPPEETLGTNQDLLLTPPPPPPPPRPEQGWHHFANGKYGPVPRNIRLALSMIDLVEPYVSILSVERLDIWDDVVPFSPRNGTSCQRTKRVLISVPKTTGGGQEQEQTTNNNKNNGLDKVSVRWIVGGGINVDHTHLIYGSTEAFKDAPFMTCFPNQVTQHEMDAFLGQTRNNQKAMIYSTPLERGKTRWHPDIAVDNEANEELLWHHPMETMFAASIDLSMYREGDLIMVYALARVDQGWSRRGEQEKSTTTATSLPPQSHLVHARTNPNWKFQSKNGQQIIQGRLDWLSIPLAIELGPPSHEQQQGDNENKQAFRAVHSPHMIEKSVRNPLDEWKPPPPSPMSSKRILSSRGNDEYLE